MNGSIYRQMDRCVDKLTGWIVPVSEGSELKKVDSTPGLKQ